MTKLWKWRDFKTSMTKAKQNKKPIKFLFHLTVPASCSLSTPRVLCFIQLFRGPGWWRFSYPQHLASKVALVISISTLSGETSMKEHMWEVYGSAWELHRSFAVTFHWQEMIYKTTPSCKEALEDPGQAATSISAVTWFV